MRTWSERRCAWCRADEPIADRCPRCGSPVKLRNNENQVLVMSFDSLRGCLTSWLTDATSRWHVLDVDGPASRPACQVRLGSVWRLGDHFGWWGAYTNDLSRVVRVEAAQHAEHARSVGADARETYRLHAGDLDAARAR